MVGHNAQILINYFVTRVEKRVIKFANIKK